MAGAAGQGVRDTRTRAERDDAGTVGPREYGRGHTEALNATKRPWAEGAGAERPHVRGAARTL